MVDFDKHRDANLSAFELTGGAAHGGLTVRDYFAAKAMQEMIGLYAELEFSTREERMAQVVATAWEFSDLMMKERNKPAQQSAPTVEEAFGFTQPVPVEGGLSVKAQLYGEDK